MNERDSQTSLERDSEEIAPRMRSVLGVVAWWREVCLGTLLAAIGGGMLMLAIRILLPQYETSSAVALLRVSSNVAIDKRFSTGATASNGGAGRQRRSDVVARRAALVGLVESGDVASAVAERLSEELDEKEAHPTRLLERIDAELVTIGTISLRNTSDLIRITVRADAPEKATLIADVWAEEFTDQVNRLYRFAPRNQLNTLLVELERTQEDHDAAQKALAAFIADSNIERLTDLISTKRSMLDNLLSLRDEMISNEMLTLQKIQERRNQSVSLKVDSLRKLLGETFAIERKLQQVLMNARDLRSQIEKGGEASVGSNTIPLLMIKAEAYASGSRLPRALEISLDDDYGAQLDKATMLADLGAVIQTLEERINSLGDMTDAQIRNLNDREFFVAVNGSASFLNESDQREIILLKEVETRLTNDVKESSIGGVINQLEAEIQELRAEVEMKNATIALLIQKRDVQRSALESLQNEIVELKLTMSAFTSEVRVASHAPTPVDSSYPSALLIGSLGGTGALLVAICLAFAANSEGVAPLLERRRFARSEQNRDVG